MISIGKQHGGVEAGLARLEERLPLIRQDFDAFLNLIHVHLFSATHPLDPELPDRRYGYIRSGGGGSEARFAAVVTLSLHRQKHPVTGFEDIEVESHVVCRGREWAEMSNEIKTQLWFE